MRTLAAILVLLLSAAAHAAGPDSWIGLEAGPHAVGFKQLERSDPSRPFYGARRLDGTPRARDRARPLRINVWYPAQATASPAMTVGNYVDLLGVEEQLGPLTPERATIGRNAYFAFPLLRDLDPAQRERLLRLSTAAHRDAAPARGKFPVVLYSLGTAAIHHVTPEYLASHGYIVAQAPRMGLYAGMPPDGQDLADFASKIEDMHQIIDALASVPEADLDNVSALGFSAGGRWALHMAMERADLRAVVSLDTVMLFDDAVSRAWRQHPRYDLLAVRAPVLHIVRKEWVPREDLAVWRGLKHAERYRLVVEDPVLDHLDFQSAGLEQTLAGGRPQRQKNVRAAFLMWNRATLAFLDANQKDSEPARRAVAGLPGAEHLAAEPAPLLAREFFNAIADDGPAATVAAVRARKLTIAENALNLAGYGLLLGGRPRESLPVFQLMVDSYPSSANAHDSLADACLANGDRACAVTHTQRAQALLDADKDLPAARREAIQKSIDDRRAQLK